MGDRPGHIIAADLRLRADEGEGPWLGLRKLCPNCCRYLLELDGAWCWECNHPEEAERRDREARRLAIAELKARMPGYLRSKGFFEEAARWE